MKKGFGMHWVLCCVVAFCVSISFVQADGLSRTPFCWLKTYQPGLDQRWVYAGEVFLDARTLDSMEKFEYHLPGGEEIYSIQFNSSKKGLYYRSETARNLDLHRLYHGDLPEETCSYLVSPESTSSKMMVPEDFPFRDPILTLPILTLKDEKIKETERGRAREAQSAMRLSVLPGPSVAFYSFLWGDFPEMFRKGTLPYMMDVWRRYGSDGAPVKIPFGPKTMYLITDPDDFEEIKSQLEESTVKGFTVTNLRNFFSKTAIGFLETGESRSIRKGMFPHFALKPIGQGAVKGVEDYFQNMVIRSRSFIQGLKAKKEVDFEKEMAVFTMQTVAANMLGVELPEDRLERIHSAFRIVFEFVNYRMTHEPFINPWTWLPTAYNRQYSAALAEIRALVQEMLDIDQAKETQGQGEGSLIRTLRLANRQQPDGEDSKFSLTQEQVIDQVLNIFFAGHETTTHTLSMVIYALTQNPEVRERLEVEVLHQLGPNGFGLEQTPAALKNKLNEMSYLDAVVNETLRLYPAVPGIARVATQSVRVNGHQIPAGSILFLFFEGAHRLGNYWWKPEKYDPERFLSDKKDTHHPCGMRHKNSFSPFGLGERSCLGKFFALQEVKIFLAELVLSKIPFRVAEGAVVTPIAVPTKRLEFGLPMIFGDHW